MGRIKIKRIYSPCGTSDGRRILVDRLWPRGIKKENATVNQWAKEIAPSEELRKWFAHDPEKYAEFRAKYMEELDASSEAAELISLVKENVPFDNLTLLYAAKDEEHNNAVVLKDWLMQNKDIADITSE